MKNDRNEATAVRDDLVRVVGSLLIGPLQPDESIESAPVDTYVTGILWPRGTSVDAFDDDAGSEASADDEQGEESAVPGYRAIRPCSIGLTFSVKAGAIVTISLGSTSRYEPIDQSVSENADSGGQVSGAQQAGRSPANEPADTSDKAQQRPRRAWVRRQLGYSCTLPPCSTSNVTRINRFVCNGGEDVTDARLAVHVRTRVGAEHHVLTVTLINDAPEAEGSGSRDSSCLFQTELIVRAELAGNAAIEPRPQPLLGGGDQDALTNALLYRHVREFAVGHGVAASWPSDASETVNEVRTAWLPRISVAGTSAAGHDLLKTFQQTWPRGLHAAFLGDEAAKEHVVAALDSFVASYVTWIEQALSPRLATFDGELRKAAELNLQRCSATSQRIRKGVDLLRSNDVAWAAFAMANAAMDRQSRFPSKGLGAKPLVWRPFQLAFMLLVVPGLVDPGDDDRECMDLLWFPTGGGKTEAYLALTAFEIFYRRLVDADRRDRGGVDVLMRYTLRLLTVQQFQRAAALIAACDFMRTEDTRLGKARISLGLYVGGDATPNRMDKAREAIAQEQAGQKPKSSPRQLLLCPVCGSALDAFAYSADLLLPRIDIVCRHSGCETAGHPLPVLTVDDVIYAAPTSLLIGTVDKFAQIPRRTDIRTLFGIDGGTPPGLIIQDELHLISGPLGSMAGLYETVIDTLCTREGVRPKVIGSTATIGHASAQVRALFARSVLQFPPPGFDAADSFFAVKDRDGPDRLYVGMPTAGRSPKFALQAVVAALLQSVSTLLEAGRATDQNADPYWTCVAYFNSLRELGGAYVLMQDDVPRQMQFLAGRLGTDRRDLQNLPVELSSRRSSRELPELLQALAGTLVQFKEDPMEYPEPKDTVLASNMISVGVDVPRLGLMVVNGQPKSTAEYIQASSRVGRGVPGLVVTLYNFGRPRDLSHFEHFGSYHGALYRSVEATSVTPWAPRARDKAMHAVLASLVRHLVPGLGNDDSGGQFDPTDPMVAEILSSIRHRVESVSDPLEAQETTVHLDALVEEWARRSHESRANAIPLRYWIKKAPFGRTKPHLMCSAEDVSAGVGLAWATPNSMREVEPSSAFVLKRIPARVERN